MLSIMQTFADILGFCIGLCFGACRPMHYFVSFLVFEIPTSGEIHQCL